jgi:glycosyltransferase involved in cell wall biosynthesis
MRVGVDARTCLSPNPRGEGKSILRLYREIAVLRPNWGLIFYGDRKDQAPATALPTNDVRIFETPGFRFSTWETVGLPARSWLDGVDMTHFTSSNAPYWSPVPFIVTVHDVIPLVYPDGWQVADVDRFRTSISRAVQRAAAIIVPSSNSRNDLVRVTGAAGDRVHVIPWGADSDVRAPESGEIDVLLGAAQIRSPFALALGGGAPRKNTEQVVRGFAAGASKDRDLTLVLAGLGSPGLRDRYRSLAIELGIERQIRILEYVSEPLLEALYRRAICLLYLSSYEGFGLPVLEAMARGLPVIAANKSSIPEVAGDAAALFDPADIEGWANALLGLCRSEAMRQTMAQRGRAQVSRFSWTETARSTINLFEQVIA